MKFWQELLIGILIFAAWAIEAAEHPGGRTDDPASPGSASVVAVVHVLPSVPAPWAAERVVTMPYVTF